MWTSHPCRQVRRVPVRALREVESGWFSGNVDWLRAAGALAMRLAESSLFSSFVDWLSAAGALAMWIG